MNSEKVSRLRALHPRFFYRKADYVFSGNTLTISFVFELENGPAFHPTLQFADCDPARITTLPRELLKEFAFQIGLVEMLSYWKSAVSPEIVIEAGMLAKEQLPFWESLLKKGLSEFFFVNQVNAWTEKFVRFTFKSASEPTTAVKIKLNEEALIPVGGGKDSAVVLELAKKLPFATSTLTLNVNAQVESVLHTAKVGANYTITRTIDQKLIELNNQGYFNGHTPFSALLAFISSLASVLYDKKYVALSNEWSANEGNTIFHGQTINHQYSKTYEFELAFRQYLHIYLSPDIEYFSWLRPVYELQIAAQFAKHTQYHSVFLSCNRGQKSGKWCGECPKCLFVFILLSAFLPPEKVNQIWGQDLFAKPELKKILDELTGQTEVKSLECVGTREESILALTMALATYPELKHGLWKKTQQIIATEKTSVKDASTFLKKYENDMVIPETFRQILKEQFFQTNTANKTLSALDTSLKSKYEHARILILGFGREGKSTLKKLRQIFPDKDLTIMDQSETIELEENEKTQTTLLLGKKEYLQNLSEFDCIFKTPSLSINQPELQIFIQQNKKITSQLNEFLEVYKKQTVGITGTKGKSTTSAFTHHLLWKSGFKTVLAGNIGIPPFEVASEMTPETLAVIEMASYQLESVTHSPHWAIFLNFFPEHLNYHGSLEKYFQAKSHITRFQTEQDFFIYNQSLCEFVDIEKISKAKKFSFSVSSPHSKTGGQKSEYPENELSNIFLTSDLPAVKVFSILMKISPDQLQTAVGSFQNLPHRLEKIQSRKGILFIDDTLATIPQATVAAIEAFKNISVILLGGYDRGIEFNVVVDAVIEKKIPVIIFFRPSGEKMFQLLNEKLGKKFSFPQTFFAETMKEAVSIAYAAAKPGEVVLLSPASPSFGQFQNYEDKAAQFKHWITELDE